MQVNGILDAQVGMALFDSYIASVKKYQHPAIASPLIDAAFKAFEGYLAVVETAHNAQIAGAAIYALNPKGIGTLPVTAREIAPFLALNVLA